ncbi:MAG: SDR family NAD(P)-dependent oxidoreductase [Candidatus Bathyarchaeota archaeon]|nr:SDR family NAD(P)-dependent oxidoreductase [Candidatus Bathyarchaeota archaeon]
MKNKYSSVLVTGGAGFIGSHLVDRLLENGFEVRVIDDLSTGKSENITAHVGKSSFRFVKGDIRNFETVKKAVEGVEVIFHEAALSGVRQSIDKPLLTNDVNVNGTLNLLEASLKFSVKRFIYASSAAVYGMQEAVPIKEDVVPRPDSPYGVSKLASEYYLTAYHKNYGLETVSLRYFNVYGSRQSPFYGLVITAFVEKLARNESPVIHGDGEQTRDFINVADVVEANMLAMEKSHAGEIFNVATGSSLTVNGIFKLLQSIMGKEQIEPVHGRRSRLIGVKAALT